MILLWGVSRRQERSYLTWKLASIDRLVDVSGAMQRDCAAVIGIEAGGAERNDWYAAKSIIRFEFASEAHAVHSRQRNIHQNEVRYDLEQYLLGLLRVY